MIRNDAELETTRQLLTRAEAAYSALRAELLPHSRKMFDLVAPAYTREIAGLTEAIHRYLGIPTYQLPEGADIVIRLKGRRVELGTFPAGAVGDCLKQFEDGVASIAAAHFRDSKKGAAAAKKECRFPLAGVGPGSVTLYLSAPRPTGNLFDSDTLFDHAGERIPEEAVGALATGIEECAADGTELTESELSDFEKNAVRYRVFKAVAGLLPSDPAVESVEVSFARRAEELAPRTLVITRRVATRAKKWAERIAHAGVKATETGTIRRMDLDNRSITLRGRDGIPRPLEGTFPDSLYPEMKDLLDRRVRLTGILQTRSGRQFMQVRSVEPIDLPPNQNRGPGRRS